VYVVWGCQPGSQCGSSPSAPIIIIIIIIIENNNKNNNNNNNNNTVHGFCRNRDLIKNTKEYKVSEFLRFVISENSE
jgi:hypothetical protein